METFRKIVTVLCLIFAAIALFFLVTSRFVESLVALFIGGILFNVVVVTLTEDGPYSWSDDDL